VLVGCSSLEDYPANNSTSSPGTDPPVVKDRNNEYLVKEGGDYTWEIGEPNSITVLSITNAPLTFKVTGAPDWMTIDTNFPGKNKLVIGGTPTSIGRYEINIHVNSSSGYDDAFYIIRTANTRPAVEG
jgi:hypothetical protein